MGEPDVQTAVTLRPARTRWLEVWLPLAILVFDQITKALIRAELALHESVTIIPGLVDFTHIRNTGAAFGILNYAEFPFKTAVIVTIATAGLIGVAIYSASLAQQQLAARIGLALIIGGAAGNLIDRIVVGYVVDFVDVYWRGHHFWAFNVADSAITIGVTIMILDMIGVGTHVSKTA
jgi:signal peptidase II